MEYTNYYRILLLPVISIQIVIGKEICIFEEISPHTWSK